MKRLLILILMVAVILTIGINIENVRGYEGSDNQENENTSESKKSSFIYININDKGSTKLGLFDEDETIFLSAEKIKGYEFLSWEIDGEKFSEEKEIDLNTDKRDIKVKANYENLAKEVDELIKKADEEILNENYDKAQKYLLEVYEYDKSIIEKSKYYENLEVFLADYNSTEDNLNKFTKDNISTARDYIESIKEYENQKPEPPKIEILERKPEEIHDWFYKFLFYTEKIRRNPLMYVYFANLETENAIREEESEYLVNPEGSYWHLGKRSLIKSKIYLISQNPEYDMPVNESYILHYLDLKEVIVEEGKVIISMEKTPGYPSLSYFNTGGKPYIKSCDAVFKIKKYDDGTFKIKDYYIDNMITER
ncbi:MAG TPA: hypothetical protein VJ892_02445 [Candidatus Absconditabacterales bacterium]|nr:hypothetical protein [Candidatus Absconditabacterales bacterium]